MKNGKIALQPSSPPALQPSSPPALQPSSPPASLVYSLKTLCLALGLTFSTISLANEAKPSNGDILPNDIDLTNELQNSTTGIGRFRAGGFFGAGFYKSKSPPRMPSVGSFAIEAGVYTLFNPIRNWVDIEVGLKGLLGIPTKTSTKSDDNPTREIEKYYNGLLSATAYIGPVFQFGNEGQAIALGIYKDLYIKSFQLEEAEKANVPKVKYTAGMGAYAEYQYTDFKKAIPYIRLTYGTYNTQLDNPRLSSTPKLKEKLFGISFGSKF